MTFSDWQYLVAFRRYLLSSCEVVTNHTEICFWAAKFRREGKGSPKCLNKFHKSGSPSIMWQSLVTISQATSEIRQRKKNVATIIQLTSSRMVGSHMSEECKNRPPMKLSAGTMKRRDVDGQAQPRRLVIHDVQNMDTRWKDVGQGHRQRGMVELNCPMCFVWE